MNPGVAKSRVGDPSEVRPKTTLPCKSLSDNYKLGEMRHGFLIMALADYFRDIMFISSHVHNDITLSMQ